MQGWTDESIDRGRDGWMVRWMGDGRVVRQLDRWTDGQRDLNNVVVVLKCMVTSIVFSVAMIQTCCRIHGISHDQ